MEKDIGKIQKNDVISIIVRVDDFGGRVGLTIREYTESERYTGFTKSGTRIPAEHFQDFKRMINSIDENIFTSVPSSQPSQDASTKKQDHKPAGKIDKKQKTLKADEIEEEIF